MQLVCAPDQFYQIEDNIDLDFEDQEDAQIIKKQAGKRKKEGKKTEF